MSEIAIVFLFVLSSTLVLCNRLHLFNFQLLDSSVKLMDGMSPLEIELPGPLNALKKPLLRVVKGTVVEKLLRDHNVIKDGMLD